MVFGAKRTYPSLPAILRQQLEAVTPSRDYELTYYPCDVTLLDGRRLDHVYLCEAQSWYRRWGVWPDQDVEKKDLAVLAVAAVRSSLGRLPANFANQLYQAGESGMGGTFFAVEFRNGARVLHEAGNAIDFVTYPHDLGPTDIARVIPHEGRLSRDRVRCPEYHWCLFENATEIPPSTS